MLSGSCFGGRVFVCLFAWVDGGEVLCFVLLYQQYLHRLPVLLP